MPDPSTASGVAQSGAIVAKDVIGWALAGLSLAWNLWNRIRTDKLGRELRQSTFGLDEWKTHRTAINTRLSDFEDAGDRLLSLRGGDHPAPALREELNKEGRQLMMAHEALLRALTRAGDNSWQRHGYGRYEGGESDWDRLNNVLADIGDLGDDAVAIRSSLAPIRDHLGGISDSVALQIRVATAEHDPNRI